VGLRTAWPDGPCAFLLATRTGPDLSQASEDFLLGGAGLRLALLAAVLIAAGPIVARIRQLTAEVRHSAAGRYAVAVNASGRDEITELARAFNEAGSELRRRLDELERREEALRQFVANTTHDVMVPLTVLQGHLSAVRKALDRGSPVNREF